MYLYKLLRSKCTERRTLADVRQSPRSESPNVTDRRLGAFMLKERHSVGTYSREQLQKLSCWVSSLTMILGKELYY